MPTTNTNFSSLITAIDSKAQSLAASTTDPKDLVFLGKAVEALNVPDTVSAIIAEGDTQVAAVNTAGTTQVGNVNTAGTTQVAAIQAAGGSYATQANVDALIATITVTAVSGAFVIDGTNKKALNLIPSVVYRFDVSDASNASHPLKFSTTADGTHASGGTEFTTGVTAVGTQGTAGAYVQIIVEQDSVNLFYYCSQHSGMGNTAYSAYNVLSTAPSDGEVLTYNAAQGVYINTAASSGNADTEVADPTLDTFSTNLQSQGKYMNVSNLNAYSLVTRIRGLDDASKAYGGINNMVRTGSASGNMQHHFSLFSANQSTGAITFEASTVLHNNTGSTADYSTFGRAADEWTGRHSYMGNIPRNGQNHNYGYDQAFIYNTSGAKSSSHINSTTHYPHGNQGHQTHWVDPSEHRIGGAVDHFIDAYASSDSKARVVQFSYNYSTSALNQSVTNSAPFNTTGTSTNYNVRVHQQYPVTSPSYQPYYTAFHSFQEGLYAKNYGSSWQNLGSSYSLSPDYTCFFLSNGNSILERSGELWLIAKSNGAITSLGITGHAEMPLTSMSYYDFCWNIGTDEWLQALPDSRWCKFKFNPTTGAVTRSTNTVVIPSLSTSAFDPSAHSKTGLFSKFSPSTISHAAKAFTFGTELSGTLGNGYGRTKLMFLGHDNSSKLLVVKTYDLVPIINALTY
mgnify:FL=1|tara:strand:- start:3431 stop:5476 length:2046 start_codon:yes stop_codon:yes gene_type:complete